MLIVVKNTTMNNNNIWLNKRLKEVAEEYKFINPKFIMTDVPRCGFFLIPKNITIEEIATGSDRKSLHLFLKSAPQFYGSALNLRDYFNNEITIYTTVLPAFLQFQKDRGVSEPFNSYPKCYGCSSEKENEFLIFDDLTKIDYTLWDHKKAMAVNAIKICFEQFAKLHAISFAFSEKEPEMFDNIVKLLPLTCFHDQMTQLAKMYIANGRKALACFDRCTEKEVYNKLEKFVEEDIIKVLGYQSTCDKSVIIHGDNGCYNFMFNFKDVKDINSVERVSFLDWQSAKFVSPAIELCNFFYSNAPQEAFDNLEYFLKFYHDTLSSALIEMDCHVEKVYPCSLFEQHWKKYAKGGLMMACTSLIMYSNEQIFKDYDLDKLAKSKSGYADIFGGPGIHDNEEFKKRLRGIVFHFINNEFI